MITVAIANHKGGVAKTITAQNLASGVSHRNKKTLMIDFDPQANLTEHCGIFTTEGIKTISDYLDDDILPIEPLQIGDNKNLFLIPSSETLDQDNIDMGAMDDPDAAVRLLKEIIKRVDGQYDYVFIDCAASSSMLMLNAIIASDEIIIPIADKDSLVGITKIKNIITANNLNTDIKFLITKYDSRVGVNRDIKDYLIENSPEKLFHTIIRLNAKLNEAANIGVDIFSYNSKCNGALDYILLAKEFLSNRKK